MNTTDSVRKYEGLHYRVKDKVATLTLAMAARHNALSTRLIASLHEAFHSAKQDKDVKVIVLNAEGKSFCAGADLDDLCDMEQNSFEENLENSQKLKDLFHLIYTCPKVTIAEVQGAAIAGGCGLVALCDFVFAAPHTRFGCSEVRIGFVAAIMMYFLMHRVGVAWARDLTLSGRLISAERAHQLGLVNTIFPADTLARETHSFAQELVAKNSFHSMQLTKSMLHHIQGLELNEALQYAAEMNASMRTSDDCKAGIRAFVEKRSIDWTHR